MAETWLRLANQAEKNERAYVSAGQVDVIQERNGLLGEALRAPPGVEHPNHIRLLAPSFGEFGPLLPP